MLDKKINETIESLIKKIKDNNLGSIKLSNKTNTIEISNTSNYDTDKITQNILPTKTENIKNDNIITIDSPMVGIIYLTPKPSFHHLLKKAKRLKKVTLSA